MIITKSLRLKIILVFCGFSCLLGCAIFVGILVTTRHTESYALKKRLDVESDRYVESILNSPVSPVAISHEVPIPNSLYMTSYIGRDLLPEWADKSIGNLKPGDYERSNEYQKYYISVRELPDGEKFYLLFNVTTLLMDHEYTNIMRKYFMISLLPVFLIGLTLGIITASKAISPVIRLTRIVKKEEETGELPDDMLSRFDSDEIGFLATTLHNAITEMRASINREKTFARDASHELRTPVTVVQGALKILSDDIGDDMEKQLVLSRIQRATNNMEHLINSLLWLSRQERKDVEGVCDAASIVRESVDYNAYLLRSKCIKVTVEEMETTILPVSGEIFSVVIGNLIRNAFTYTLEGDVKITINRQCVNVSDTGMGITKNVMNSINKPKGVSNANGFGFGLSLVYRMCNTLGWTLKIESEDNKGTSITVYYKTGRAELLNRA